MNYIPKDQEYRVELPFFSSPFSFKCYFEHLHPCSPLKTTYQQKSCLCQNTTCAYFDKFSERKVAIVDNLKQSASTHSLS